MRILLKGFSADGSLSVGAQDDFAVEQDLFESQLRNPLNNIIWGCFKKLMLNIY